MAFWFLFLRPVKTVLLCVQNLNYGDEPLDLDRTS